MVLKVSSGASGDFRSASSKALAMVTEWGLAPEAVLSTEARACSLHAKPSFPNTTEGSVSIRMLVETLINVINSLLCSTGNCFRCQTDLE
eukprot:299025-Amphidinium_carterae.1